MSDKLAFPTQIDGVNKYGDPGMALRDYFAANALLGILVAPMGKFPYLNGGESSQAEAAYHIADAMLKARESE